MIFYVLLPGLIAVRIWKKALLVLKTVLIGMEFYTESNEHIYKWELR